MVQAGSMGAPFVPTLGYAGSDVIKRRPDDFTIVANPFAPGERIVVAKAINPDVGIFHGLKADREGNVILRKGGEELLLIQASRKVIVTVEEIAEKLDPEASRARFIHSVYITAVVHAPFGAHPTGAPGYYAADDELLREYLAASASDETFGAYLDKYVFERESHDGYLKHMGFGRSGSVAP
jgi:glutaconate CoA-transferase, subunit A